MPKYRPMMTMKQKKEMSKHKESDVLSESYEDKHYYPQSIRLSENNLPEVDKFEVGKTYRLEILVKMTEYSANSKNKNFGRFEIMGVKALDGKLDTEQKKVIDFMSKGTGAKMEMEEEDDMD